MTGNSPDEWAAPHERSIDSPHGGWVERVAYDAALTKLRVAERDRDELLSAAKRVVELTRGHKLLAAEMDIPLLEDAIAKCEGK